MIEFVNVRWLYWIFHYRYIGTSIKMKFQIKGFVVLINSFYFVTELFRFNNNNYCSRWLKTFFGHELCG